MSNSSVKQNQEQQEPAPSSVAQSRTLNLDALAAFANAKKQVDYRQQAIDDALKPMRDVYEELVAAGDPGHVEDYISELAGVAKRITDRVLADTPSGQLTDEEQQAIASGVMSTVEDIRNFITGRRPKGMTDQDRRDFLDSLVQIEQYVTDQYARRWYRFHMQAMQHLWHATAIFCFMKEMDRRAGEAFLSHSSTLQKSIIERGVFAAMRTAEANVDGDDGFEDDLYRHRDRIAQGWHKARQQAIKDAAARYGISNFSDAFIAAGPSLSEAQSFVANEIERIERKYSEANAGGES